MALLDSMQDPSRWERLLQDLTASGISIDPSQSGGFNPRNIAGTNTPSQHSFGRALDINWTANPQGRAAPNTPLPYDMYGESAREPTTQIHPDIARDLSRRHGMRWGGDFSNPDPMHFEMADSNRPMADRTLVAGRSPEPPPAPMAAPFGAPQALPSSGPSMTAQAPQAMPHTQGPQAPMGAGSFFQGLGDWGNRLVTNPAFMAGLSILGTQPGGNWGPAGTQAASTTVRSRIEQSEGDRLNERRRNSERVWREAFGGGQPNMNHPLLRGVPEDLANTVMAMGPDEGLPALQKHALTRSTRTLQDRLMEAQIRNYDARSQSTVQRGQATEMNAETRRRVANYDTFIDRFGNNPSEADWEAENRQGGLIPAVFGRMVPFDERETAVRQVQAQRDQAQTGGEEPSSEELRAAGVRPEDAARRRQQTVLRWMYGDPPKNHRWRPDGTAEPIPGYGTQGERQAQTTATQGLAMLEEAEKLLGNTGTLEHLAGDRWFTRPDGTGGFGGFGEAGRGYRAARGAITNLVFALSGKQVSNAERQNFMDIYSPMSTDSRETQQWKLQQVRNFFQAVVNARRNGADDDAVGEMFRRAAAERQNGPAERAPNPKQAPPSSAPAGDGWSVRRLP